MEEQFALRQLHRFCHAPSIFYSSIPILYVSVYVVELYTVFNPSKTNRKV